MRIKKRWFKVPYIKVKLKKQKYFPNPFIVKNDILPTLKGLGIRKTRFI